MLIAPRGILVASVCAARGMEKEGASVVDIALIKRKKWKTRQ
jgi:hypothetical protein